MLTHEYFFIQASQIGYTHTRLIGSKIQIKAMDSVTNAVNDGVDPLLPFAYSRRYLGWETNKVEKKQSLCYLT